MALAAVHRMPRRGVIVQAFRVQLHGYEFGIEIAKENLNLEEELRAFLFNRRGAKSHRGPMLRELRSPILQLVAQRSVIRGTLRVSRRSRQVMPLRVLSDNAISGKKRSQFAHAFAHASNPFARNSSIIARIEFGNNLSLE
jgi:hypothetical protein